MSVSRLMMFSLHYNIATHVDKAMVMVVVMYVISFQTRVIVCSGALLNS